MTNQTNVEMLRKELRTLADIEKLDIGPMARSAAHERMLTLAFELNEALPAIVELRLESTCSKSTYPDKIIYQP